MISTRIKKLSTVKNLKEQLLIQFKFPEINFEPDMSFSVVFDVIWKSEEPDQVFGFIIRPSSAEF